MHASLFSAVGWFSPPVARRAAFGLLATLAALLPVPASHAIDLPWWVDSIEVSQPGFGGIGAVTLSGTWIDTGAPDAISHSVRDGALHFSVSAPDLNVATGDALTPWTLTEEFGPLDPFAGPGGVNSIFGSIFSVDPNERGIRELVSGPDLLGWIVPPPRGEFHGLGTGEAYVSAAYDVSADGRVVVGANRLAPNAAGLKTSEAFAWSPSTGKVALGVLPGGVPGGSTAFGVSADGNHVVGGSTTTVNNSQTREAFHWSFGSGMESLGTIHGASSSSVANATSRNGQVVVGADAFYPPGVPSSVPQRHAFRYTESGGMEDLGVLDVYGERSATEAIDVSQGGGVVVGTAYRGENSADADLQSLAQPFRWVARGGMVGLGNLSRPALEVYQDIYQLQQETIANAVSADGQAVVGVDRIHFPPQVDSRYPYWEEDAVLWRRDIGWVELGEFRVPGPLDFVGSEATDVSAEGDWVVGQAFIYPWGTTDAPEFDGPVDGFGRLQVPFLWDEQRGMRPLARVLAGDYGLDLEGWVLGEATAISDDGTTIVGTGLNPDGVREAWRAVLYRNTRAGDADFDGDVDLVDRAMLESHLGMNSGEDEVYYGQGDFDGDGEVGAGDLELLLANYDARAVGDFNADGVVDAADYTLWRDRWGQETGVADANGDGRADAADLVAWRANYGMTLDAIALATAVPEPSAGALIALAIATASTRRRR